MTKREASQILAMHRDHYDLVYSKAYPSDTPTSHLQLKEALSIAIRALHIAYIDETYIPGTYKEMPKNETT